MVAGHGFGLIGVTPSPISGGDGNREFLLAARAGDSGCPKGR